MQTQQELDEKKTFSIETASLITLEEEVDSNVSQDSTQLIQSPEHTSISPC